TSSSMPAPAAKLGMLRRILVVDDEESLRHMLQVFLTREGYEVVSVGNAPSALAEIEQHDYDCVVTDVRMPKVSGLDLLDQLARRPRAPTVTVMSADGANDPA